MAKFLFTFTCLTLILSTAIIAWRSLSSRDRWSLLKTFGFSMLVGTIAGALLVVFVQLF